MSCDVNSQIKIRITKKNLGVITKDSIRRSVPESRSNCNTRKDDRRDDKFNSKETYHTLLLDLQVEIQKQNKVICMGEYTIASAQNRNGLCDPKTQTEE